MFASNSDLGTKDGSRSHTPLSAPVVKPSVTHPRVKALFVAKCEVRKKSKSFSTPYNFNQARVLKHISQSKAPKFIKFQDVQASDVACHGSS